MESTEELVLAKKNLDQSLGDNFKIYLQTMRQWFTQELTKEEFDSRVRQFLTKDSLQAHNRFLLSVLNKCSDLANFGINTTITAQPFTTTTTTTTDKTEPKVVVKTEFKPIPKFKPKHKPVVKPLAKKLKTKMNFDHRFERSANENQLRSIKPLDDCEKLLKVSYCQRESVLPDNFMSQLRVFVIAWEMGLDVVQDNAVKLCNAALRDFIKSILTQMFASRSSYRLRDKRFKYCIGGPPLNPYLKNSYPLLQESDHSSSVTNPESGESQPVRPTIDDATNKAMYWMACGGKQSHKRVQLVDEAINLRHLVNCIKTNPNLISSYSVRSNAYYKSISKLAQFESNSTND